MAVGATDNSQEWQGHIDRPPPDACDERRRRWANLLRNQHYEPVIFDILSDELPKYTNSCVIDPTDVVVHMRECALILASAPEFFFAAVEGNLVSRMSTDTDLQAEYAAIKQRAYRQPSIYIHLLADEEGNAPTPIQYLVIRDTIQYYLGRKSSELAHHIDNVTPPFVSIEASTRGYRKYLHTPSTDRSPRRIATLLRLCGGIGLRCSQVSPYLQDISLPYPPAEVGYALHAHQRLAQHRAHRSSNYVMNLVEDICIHLFRTKILTQHFKMHQYIIYLIFRPSQAAIAEIFCSGLLQCWVNGGGGFNAYPAGRSVASSRKVSGMEWAEHETLARQVSPLEERMEVMKERAEVWRKALDWKKEDEEHEDTDAEEAAEGGDSMDVL
ncbi:hypothetical protein BU25DRAFT_401095 [Macroventuria anomochaeta]|uniref:Uncharacterized protein n=1 Tax=Macroventuria anomochaeta TaxID=301207 RepID=A0ACB6RN69_9PLEO|nr:uncharacterized protein BU25DRAFT_401095 [Macroventuria anomochaeta]KAF2623253.1 hypothetical protein BU25DRAFT_401095 [Macroventuria anomochaeta]